MPRAGGHPAPLLSTCRQPLLGHPLRAVVLGPTKEPTHGETKKPEQIEHSLHGKVGPGAAGGSAPASRFTFGDESNGFIPRKQSLLGAKLADN